ncbi:MAG: hypothetical protein JO021_17915 [Alphaproteobacteria bacterium]|nr:hypothetical protein [Alphaproteobacteria bacterium]
MALNLRSITLTVAGLAAAAVLSFATSASAQMADSPRALEILARWNEATQAVITCEGRRFSLDDETKIAEATARATNAEYLTGSMLQTVSDRRPWVRTVQASMTCRDPMIMDRIAFFKSTVAPGAGLAP